MTYRRGTLSGTTDGDRLLATLRTRTNVSCDAVGPCIGPADVALLVQNARATIAEMYRRGQLVTMSVKSALVPRAGLTAQQRSAILDELSKLDPMREATLEAGKRSFALGNPIPIKAALQPVLNVAALAVPGVAAVLTAAQAANSIKQALTAPSPPAFALPLPSPTTPQPFVAPAGAQSSDSSWMVPLGIGLAVLVALLRR